MRKTTTTICVPCLAVLLASMAFVSFFATPRAYAQAERPACPQPFGEDGFFQLNEEGKIELSVVLEAPGLTKDRLYRTAKSWYLELLRSSKNLGGRAQKRLTTDDKEVGSLVGVGVSPPYGSPRIPDLQVTLRILVRDSESEISISDLVVWYEFLLGSVRKMDPLSAEKFFNVQKPHRRYKKKTGEMIKIRRLECEDLIEYGNVIVQSYSEAIEHERAADAE